MALGFLSKLLAAAAAADRSVGIEEPKLPKLLGNVAINIISLSNQTNK
jgi:hypothetical protein